MELLNLSYHHPGSRLLVVDDEPNIRTSLVHALILEGYDADSVASGEEALTKLSHTAYDLMILDMNMPGINGIEVMKAARKIKPDLLIVVLTGHASLESAIAAVKFHATDYLLKPVPIRDMVNCVNKALQANRQRRQQQHLLKIISEAVDVIRRNENLTTNSVDILAERFIHKSPLTLDCQKRIVSLDDSPAVLQLTEGEALVLECFMTHPGQLFTCRELVHAVWGYMVNEQSAKNMIRPHISRLRRKIGSAIKERQLICTVRGQGYFFATEEKAESHAPPKFSSI